MESRETLPWHYRIYERKSIMTIMIFYYITFNKTLWEPFHPTQNYHLHIESLQEPFQLSLNMPLSCPEFDFVVQTRKTDFLIHFSDMLQYEEKGLFFCIFKNPLHQFLTKNKKRKARNSFITVFPRSRTTLFHQVFCNRMSFFDKWRLSFYEHNFNKQSYFRDSSHSI